MKEKPGWVIWLTGLPASGKTTVAQLIQQMLSAQNVDSILLDSDTLRQILTPQPSYTPAERDAFYAEIVGLAELLSNQGANVIIAATGNHQRYRNSARTRLSRFREVWVRCPLDVCQARDPKGLYAQADANRNRYLPGVGALYEPPETPDVIVDTEEQRPEESAHQIIMACGLLPPDDAVVDDQKF